MKYRITYLPGDGIGPEIMVQALRVLKCVGLRFGFEIDARSALIGGAAIDECGVPLPESTIAECKSSDAVLLAAVGGKKWDALPGDKRPEAGLLRIRQELGLYANLRPAMVYPALRAASPLKDEILGEGLDLMIVRELTGGMYFGERGRFVEDGQPTAFDTEKYSRPEIERILRVGFEIARGRSKKLCSIDKANVLESSRLWRETAVEMACEYPDVELSHLYVDNAAMQLVRAPRQFDTIVTNNIFGDILSDEASQITGSIGMLPSASLSGGAFGLYEPIHGSAPDIAGLDVANPLAMILSAAMMLRHSLNQPEAAACVEAAVSRSLDLGLRTADITLAGEPSVGTRAMGDAVVEAIMFVTGAPAGRS